MAESRRYINPRTIIAALTLTLLGGYYITSSNMSTSTSIPGLSLSLSQTAKSPPTLRVTLHNSHPSKTYTLLKWGTPLDSAALNTGLFKVVDAQGVAVEQTVLQLRRKMPPGQEELIGVAPGGEESVEVVFDRPWMPEAKPAVYKVSAEGTVKGGWEREKSGVSDGDTGEYVESELAGKTWSVDEVEMVVE